jgi:hypothetical protein
MEFNREKAIEALIDADKDYILNGDGGGLEWLSAILENGHTGYTMQTDTELTQECKERDLPLDHYMVATTTGA